MSHYTSYLELVTLWINMAFICLPRYFLSYVTQLLNTMLNFTATKQKFWCWWSQWSILNYYNCLGSKSPATLFKNTGTYTPFHRRLTENCRNSFWAKHAWPPPPPLSKNTAKAVTSAVVLPYHCPERQCSLFFVSSHGTVNFCTSPWVK